MNEEQRKQVIETALRMLPKYGGFVDGAVNQAFLLTRVDFTLEIFQEIRDEVEARAK